jgi:hypothetical protein
VLFFVVELSQQVAHQFATSLVVSSRLAREHVVSLSLLSVEGVDCLQPLV